MSLRIAFLGTPAPAVPALKAFAAAADVQVAAVITNPDRPAGRGMELRSPPVKQAALDAGLEVWQPTRPREVLADLRALRVDACAVVAYGALLPPDVLDAGGAGFVNLHFSLLPAWRGAAPVPHAIAAGDAVTGVTCFVLEAGMDTGPVLSRWETPIGRREDAGALTVRLAEAGAPLLVEAVRSLVDSSLTPQPQDHDRATYAPKIAPEDARIDWTAPAGTVDRVVRAYHPVPGAHTTFRGQRLKLHAVHPLRAVDLPAGAVAERDGLPLVGCGRGAVRLDEVQPAGKARMDGRSFANGYQPVGERLGG